MAESYSDNKISFLEDGYTTAAATAGDVNNVSGRVNSETWEPLEKLAKGEVRQYFVLFCLCFCFLLLCSVVKVYLVSSRHFV